MLRPTSQTQPMTHRNSALLAGLGLLSVFILGCGGDVYKQRLKQTEGYFRYLAKVDASLADDSWENRQFGIELRVPRQFRLIRKLKVDEQDPETDNSASEDVNNEDDADNKKDDDAEREESNQDNDSEDGSNENTDGDFDEGTDDLSTFDSRQPSFLDAQLPGLIAAWQATLAVDTDGEENEQQSRAAYIYLLGNHQMLLDRVLDDTLKPLEFWKNVDETLATGLHIPVGTPEEPWIWKTEQLPQGHEYVPSKELSTLTISLENETDEAKIDFQVFRMKAKDIQLVLLFVIPQGVDRSEHLKDGMTLCLESLKVSSKTPRQKSRSKSKKGKAKRSGGPGF